jgi:hypothetical protein
MQQAVLLAIVLAAAPIAGCIGGEDVSPSGEDTQTQSVADLPEVANPTSLKQAHPDFGFPTINDPAQGVEGEVPAWWAPPEPRELPDEVTSVEHVVNDEVDEERGAGIAVFGSLAIVPGFRDETTIYDISDPQNPEKLADLGDPPARDVDTIAFPDGTLYAVFATDSGVVPVYDLTDPTQPEKVASIEPDRGSHNVAVVPGTPILYNSASAGGNAGTSPGTSNLPDGGSEGTAIYDLSDPTNPEQIQDFENGYSCHDISFHISEDKQRAYCAGIEMTQIWDVTDPENPSVVVDIPVHHGVAGTPSAGVGTAFFSHLAMVNEDASVLIVGDENGGGVAPACDVYADAGGQSASGPSGNLWFYDISDEEDPQLQGWFSPPHHYASNPPHDDRMTEIGGAAVPAGCTAHFGQLVPGEEKIAMAFYGAGVVIVDFSDPANPVMVDQWNDNRSVWDVWTYQGYMFAGDLANGFDVYKAN